MTESMYEMWWNAPKDEEGIVAYPIDVSCDCGDVSCDGGDVDCDGGEE